MEELNVTTFDQTTDLLPNWDTYEQMKKEQEVLKLNGPTSSPPHYADPTSSHSLLLRVAEGLAYTVVGLVAGFAIRMYLKK